MRLARLGASLALTAICWIVHADAATAFLARGSLVMESALVVNFEDGRTETACVSSDVVEGYLKSRWGVEVGAAAPPADGGRKAGGVSIRCESGDGPPHIPLLVVEGSTLVRPIVQMEDERVVEVEVGASVGRLIGFEPPATPDYEPSETSRAFVFSEDAVVFLPLWSRSEGADDAAGIHEMLLRISVRSRPPESRGVYGALLLRTARDWPEVTVDGGSIGAIPAGETTLPSVRMGLHRVAAAAIDSTPATVVTSVRVEAGRTSVVDLDASDPGSRGGRFVLEPLGRNAEGFEEYRRAVDDAIVVRIPAGEFLMGNKETERSPLEHRVYLSEFLMDKTGVTWGQYKRYAAEVGVPLPLQVPYWGIHDDHPVVYVSWEDSRRYCEWAGGRLPTEAEREKAARGTDERMYPWGDQEPDATRGVYRRSWGHEATASVGSHPAGASPYGLQDMGGNVWEWCWDWYDDDYYEVGPYRDPRGPGEGRAHVLRGGSWDSRPDVLSASCRQWGHRGYREGDFGFRCAMNAP